MKFDKLKDYCIQWRSPSWAREDHSPPGKIKKLTTIDLFCEILYNFISVLSFGWFKFQQSGVVAHPKNLNNSIIDLFCETLNKFSTVIVFRGFKSGIRDFCDAYTWHVSGGLQTFEFAWVSNCLHIVLSIENSLRLQS